MSPIAALDEHDAPLAILAESIHTVADGILAESGFRVERVPGALEGEALRSAASRAQVVGIRSKSTIRASEIQSPGGILAIGCFCIGSNQVDLHAAEVHGVPVFNAPFANTRSVAELTIAEVVTLCRRTFAQSSKLHRGEWDKSAAGSHEVRGRTLGIVGYGHIGSQVSVLAEAMGMRVRYFDIARKLPLGNAQSCATLEELLRESDIVTLHVPATPITEGMVGAAQVSLMRKGAHLINNARGTVVDYAAVATALRDGRLGGLAADVFPEEPSKNGEVFASPLQGLENVILTPHIGGSTAEAQEAIAVEVAEKLAAYWRTGSTSSAVNFPGVDLPRLREGETRIMHVHRNVPGVLGRMHTLLAAQSVNINAEFLQSTRETSYVILDTELVRDRAVLQALAAMPETIRMRVMRV
ncbi:MAG: phosphoglycerate dehydrogenase [Planctomycetota bacterium]|nr:phosphoglycerate dehydrogenase [Planctomycetota bacterium]MDA1105465.1 phosphoglycerate dehydrogenase [Planctomycetota bacterium]